MLAPGGYSAAANQMLDRNQAMVTGAGVLSAANTPAGVTTAPVCLPAAVAPGQITLRATSAPAATRPPPHTTANGPTTAFPSTTAPPAMRTGSLICALGST